MRVLVTGATGFVGRHLVPQLAAEHEVVALARRAPPAALQDVADWVVGDLSGPVERIALPARIDAVVHLAQSERYRDFPEAAPDVFAVNVASTFGLLEYARGAGAERFVLASTGGVYRAGPDPLAEDAPLDPAGFYAASKAAAERLVAGYAGVLHTIVLRPFFVYGPGQTGMLIATLISRVAADEVVEIKGDPGLRLTPTYVDDAVRAFAAALRLEGVTVGNVAGDEAVTLTELVELIGEAAGVAPRITHVEAEAAGDLVADTRRMRDLLGVEPRVSLRDGLARCLAASEAEHGLPAG